MGCIVKTIKGKTCIFKDEKLLGRFDDKDVDSSVVERWIGLFDGSVEGWPHDSGGNGSGISWSSGIRERKRLAKRVSCDPNTWDTRDQSSDDLPEDVGDEDEGDEES